LSVILPLFKKNVIITITNYIANTCNQLQLQLQLLMESHCNHYNYFITITQLLFNY